MMDPNIGDSSREETPPEMRKKRILVLKRAVLLEEDMFDLPQPEDGGTLRVKMMTYPILLPQGIYVVAGWDMDARRPGILILNHTLLPALRNWMRDYMMPAEEMVFEVSPTSMGGIVGYNLYPLGRVMTLSEENLQRMNDYLDDLLGEVEVEVPE
jgi:hypothetical protein